MKVFHKVALSMLVLALSLMVAAPASAGVTTANGWFGGNEIYYIDHGLEKVAERGDDQIYLIGDNRLYQANVIGEKGVHWNVNIVHTAPGKTVQDIVDAGFASPNFVAGATENNVLFDDAADILAAQSAGLVTIDHPGVVVLCPIVSESAAESNGNNPLSETFKALNLDSTF